MTAAALKMKAHDACSLFPMIGGEEYQALKRDIVEHGQREPVIVVDGVVVDGRNRLRACRELGLEPVVRELTAAEAGDVHALVISLNLHRRHLTAAERGSLLAAYMERIGAGKKQGKRTDRGQGTSASIAEVARDLGINERTARHQVAKARERRNGVAHSPAKKTAPKRMKRRTPAPEEQQALHDCASDIAEAVADVLLAFPKLRAPIAARLELIAEGLRAEGAT